MPTLPAPLFNKVYKNANGVVLTDEAARQYNGFLERLGGVSIRPGEVLAINPAARNDGLYMWPDKNYIVCVDNGNVHLRTVSGQTLVNAFAHGVATFPTGVPVIFCNDANTVFMAAGGKINYVSTVGLVTELLDTDAPTNVTHVAFIDGYILANNGDGKLYFSNIPTTTDWSALDFASAEGNPDKIQGIYVVQRQIFLIGTISTELWENDGTTPFSRVPGGLIEMGCAAKYSPIKFGDSLMWLNHDWEFVQFTGTNVKLISSDFDKEIQDFNVVSDCIGSLVKKGGKTYCLFYFPTEQRTLAYNPIEEDWSEWVTWNSSSMSWMPYDCRAAVRDISTGQVFVGKERAQLIACLDADSRVDLTGAATSLPFKFFRQTGFVDYGTGKVKRNEELRIRVTRGKAHVTDPKLMLRYRNNGSNTWSNIRDISLGSIGETEHHVKFSRMGTYRSRQYEISCTDNVPLTMARAEEDITVLR